MNETERHVDASIILPCLNEREALVPCIKELREVIRAENLNAEIILVDNGSDDGSQAIAEDIKKDPGTRLVLLHEPRKGYGFACLRGLREGRGKYLIIFDADYSYDFNSIPIFIEKLKAGSDLVVGNRFQETMESGAMPWHHRYLGNPGLSFLVRKFFKIKIGDIHCGARAITKKAFEKIRLHTGGMEFASEMIIKAAKQNLSIAEIAVHYRVRKGHSKLQSLGDGWRHLRFILLYSPIYLFFLPGLFVCALGSISLSILYFFTPKIFGIEFYVHPMFVAAILVMLGYQIMLFGGFSRIYAITHLGETDTFLEPLFKKITIEKAGLLGILAAAIGAIIYFIIFFKWIFSGFGSLNEIKNSVVALTFIVLGVQTFFSAFMLSTLGIKET